ncbi:MAG: hypothetical protein KI785_02455 [Devosiaceae bacterium]|nr:hypothetical protein [Devosiaceae bacterium MH13]
MTKYALSGSLVDLNLAMWRMGLEASSVIAMRTMGAAGFWNDSANENQMMVREKQLAFAQGAAQATLAMWRGASPATVMLEAVKPAKQKTRSNARRLSKKGPRIPGVSR